MASGSGGLVDPLNPTFGPDGELYVFSQAAGAPSILRYDGTTGAFLGTFVSAGSGDGQSRTGFLRTAVDGTNNYERNRPLERRGLRRTGGRESRRNARIADKCGATEDQTEEIGNHEARDRVHCGFAACWLYVAKGHLLRPHCPAGRDEGLRVMTEEKKRGCAFCLKDQDDVAILVSGPNETFICDECVHLCSIIVGRAFIGKAKRAEGDAAYIEAGQKLIREDASDAETEDTPPRQGL